MYLVVLDNKTHQVVADAELSFAAVSLQPDEAEICGIVWNNAVREGRVRAEQRADYTIRHAVRPDAAYA